MDLDLFGRRLSDLVAEVAGDRLQILLYEAGQEDVGQLLRVVSGAARVNSRSFEELHARRFHAGHGLLDGNLQRFTETSMSADSTD